VIVALDTGVLGMFCAPTENRDLEHWVVGLLTRGRRVIVPDICDYELRREMIRRNAVNSIAKLDSLADRFEYAIIRPEALRLAAGYWAQLRNENQPTAPDAALDGDCVLAGQAALYGAENGQLVVIATTNVAHLGRMIDARDWSDIS
jgi:hypothetical protein